MNKYTLANAATRAPEDETGADAGAITEASRTKIANRQWINDAGESCDEELATGISYEFLGRTKGDIVVPADGKDFTVKFRDLTPAAIHMLAGFGGLTLMGNVTNTWLGEKGDREATAADAIAARIALLNEGKWIDRSAGVVGARVDKDALVAAYVEFAAERGQTKDPVAVLEKITDNPQLIKDLRSIPEVLAKYTARVGRPTKSVDDVFASV
jgi:hypothetical protein